MTKAPVIPMRTKSGDCVIAAIATAACRTYEDIAAALGIALNPNGVPNGDKWPWPRGQNPIATLEDMTGRLTAGGLQTTLVNDLPFAFFELVILACRRPAVLFIDFGSVSV